MQTRININGKIGNGIDDIDKIVFLLGNTSKIDYIYVQYNNKNVVRIERDNNQDYQEFLEDINFLLESVNATAKDKNSRWFVTRRDNGWNIDFNYLDSIVDINNARSNNSTSSINVNNLNINGGFAFMGGINTPSVNSNSNQFAFMNANPTYTPKRVTLNKFGFMVNTPNNSVSSNIKRTNNNVSNNVTNKDTYSFMKKTTGEKIDKINGNGKHNRFTSDAARFTVIDLKKLSELESLDDERVRAKVKLVRDFIGFAAFSLLTYKLMRIDGSFAMLNPEIFWTVDTLLLLCTIVDYFGVKVNGKLQKEIEKTL